MEKVTVKKAPKVKKEVKSEVTNPVLEIATITPSIEPIVKVLQEEEKRVITKDTLIQVFNNTTGEVIYINKTTGFQFSLFEYGSVDEITFGELITMKAQQPTFLNEGWLIILDEDAVSKLGLNTKYEYLFTDADIENLLKKNPDTITSILAGSTKHMKSMIVRLVKKKVENGSFTDYFTMKLIENTLKVSLTE